MHKQREWRNRMKISNVSGGRMDGRHGDLCVFVPHRVKVSSVWERTA